MPKDHIVKPGEHLTGIAEHYGFRDYKTIWEDGANAALSKKRNDHVLQPLDVLKIPDKQIKELPRPTTQKHVFQVKITKLFLRLKVRDLDFNELKGSKYEVALAAADRNNPRKGSTDGKGILKELIERPVETVVEAEARVTAVPATGEPKLHKFDLRVGFLNPNHKLSGQQARLNNLGYFAGFDVKDTDQLWWAAEEFKEDHILMGKAKVKTKPTIVEETDDPDEPTGVIDDAAFLAKLLEIHGC